MYGVCTNWTVTKSLHLFPQSPPIEKYHQKTEPWNQQPADLFLYAWYFWCGYFKYIWSEAGRWRPSAGEKSGGKCGRKELIYGISCKFPGNENMWYQYNWTF